MTTIVMGASGATGKMLVEQLLKAEQNVKVLVRQSSTFPDEWRNHDKITLVYASVSEISVDEMSEHLRDCQSIASCLGHNLSFKGIFGKPRKLVTDAVRLACAAIQQNAPTSPIKLVLMNTTGNKNRDLAEPNTLGENIVLGLIRVLIPPQRDNEQAADYLRLDIGQNNKMIEWVAVRPDTLIDEELVSDYDLHESPIRSAVFDPGKTSRINVGNFMSQLIIDDSLWNTWKGRMPVIYNKEAK